MNQDMSIPVAVTLKSDQAKADPADWLGLDVPSHEGTLRYQVVEGSPYYHPATVDVDGREVPADEVYSITPYAPRGIVVATHWIADGDAGEPSARTVFIRARDKAHAEQMVAESHFPIILDYPTADALDLMKRAIGRGYPVSYGWSLEIPVVELRDEPEPWLRTGAQVASELGLDESRVRRMAKVRGLGRSIGQARVYTPSEVDAMRTRTTGRPRKEAKP